MLNFKIKMLSETLKHAILAMVYLATHEDEQVMVSKIAEDYDIPKYYLAKIVRTLSKHQLINSSRGRNGGIKLNKPPSEIKIIDIIQAIEGPPPPNEMCLFGLDICSDLVPCPIHDTWKKMKNDIYEGLYNKNLQTMAIEIDRKHQILRD